jgi:anti-sigma regulatory factor (Ser/Thr protein kinase)
MRIELVNKLSELPNVMGMLEKFSASEGLEKTARQAAELSLDELLTNTISYGYSDSEQHEIQIDIGVHDNALKIVVQDDGVAFNPFDQEAPNLNMHIDERDLGGVGIHLVKEFMDDCAYQRVGQRNVVTLLKALGQS